MFQVQSLKCSYMYDFKVFLQTGCVLQIMDNDSGDRNVRKRVQIFHFFKLSPISAIVSTDGT